MNGVLRAWLAKATKTTILAELAEVALEGVLSEGIVGLLVDSRLLRNRLELLLAHAEDRLAWHGENPTVRQHGDRSETANFETSVEHF